MKTSIRLIPLFLLLFLIVSCTKSREVAYIPTAEEGMRVGVLLSLSGTGFSSGEASRASLEIARQDILNYFSATGINQNLTLSIVDTKTDTAEALRQIKGFYEKGIRLVIGPYSSAELAAIRGFADNHDMLAVSPSSVAVSLAIPGDNIFRFVSCDVIQGKAMAKMLTEDKIKMVVPIIRDDVWGNDLLTATQKEFVKSGGEVHPAIKYNPTVSDFSATLTQLDDAVSSVLKMYDPNDVAVYLACFAEGAIILGNAKKFTGLNNVYWYGSSAFAENTAAIADTNAALFAYTHGLPCPIFGLDDAAKSIWQPLRDRIQSQIGRQPDVYALTAYDALWVIVKAMIAAGNGASIEKIKNAFIAESNTYFGATGRTLLDTNGDRAIGNYDFWAVKRDSLNFSWKTTARYNSADGSLIRFKP
ncbi:MAG: ABC transporter substrate-binding protein [Bacteroidota bacterium]